MARDQSPCSVIGSTGRNDPAVARGAFRNEGLRELDIRGTEQFVVFEERWRSLAESNRCSRRERRLLWSLADIGERQRTLILLDFLYFAWYARRTFKQHFSVQFPYADHGSNRQKRKNRQ
jgi:hypothetical protein